MNEMMKRSGWLRLDHVLQRELGGSASHSPTNQGWQGVVLHRIIGVLLPEWEWLVGKQI